MTIEVATQYAQIFGTIATLLGLFGLAIQIGIERKRRHEEELDRGAKLTRGQAEQITAWLTQSGGKDEEGNPIGDVVIRNNSDSPVYEIILSLVSFSSGVRQDVGAGKRQDHDTYFQRLLSIAPPGKCATTIHTHQGMHFHPSIEIAFTDVKGKHWIRGSNGRLVEIPVSPTQYYEIDLPTSWYLPIDIS